MRFLLLTCVIDRIHGPGEVFKFPARADTESAVIVVGHLSVKGIQGKNTGTGIALESPPDIETELQIHLTGIHNLILEL